eukprot:834863_1
MNPPMLLLLKLTFHSHINVRGGDASDRTWLYGRKWNITIIKPTHIHNLGTLLPTDTHVEEEHKSSEHDTSIATEKDKEKDLHHTKERDNCWIYIIQNYFTQKEKLSILPCLDSYFNELSSDCLVWKELSLTSYQINTNIPYYSVSFEQFLSHKCTNLHSIDFECLAKDKLSWDILWQLISSHCLTLKNIHIGLYDGVWKFEFNQLSPICNQLLHNIQKHVDTDPQSPVQQTYLPIQRIECAPGVMPNHIVSLLKCARCLQHFFVPLIYNDTDLRWDSDSFWNIPSSLPSTLKSFRGFDAQTPLRFVHECIKNLPNIEEFHVVLYFGSAHPDFIACGYTSETFKHLATHCKHLQSFEGYFHSISGLLEGLELMVEMCAALKLVGLLFHPDVDDTDIDTLIHIVSQSVVCKRYNPVFQRLTENPNQHVTLRVLEIGFEHAQMDGTQTTTDGQKIRNKSDLYGESISSQHLKSLDEIEFSETNEEDYLMNDDELSEIGLDEKPLMRRNGNNHNHNSGSHSNVSDSNDDTKSIGIDHQ